VAGEIVSVNESLADAPDAVNNDAYGEGWLFTIRPSNEGDFDGLMSADDYSANLD
jgi:glycine cleavage system H protein